MIVQAEVVAPVTTAAASSHGSFFLKARPFGMQFMIQLEAVMQDNVERNLSG